MREDSRNSSYSFLAYYYVPSAAFDDKGHLQMRMRYNLDTYSTEMFDVQAIHTVKSFLHKVQQLSFTGTNIILVGDTDTCSEWSFRIDYGFETHTKIRATVNAKSFPCAIEPNPIGGFNPMTAVKNSGNTSNTYFFMVALLMCSLMGLYFSWKNVYETGINYMTLRFLRKRQRLQQITGNYLSEDRGGLINVMLCHMIVFLTFSVLDVEI